MIGNSQGEAEIPLDCYLSWMSPKGAEDCGCCGLERFEGDGDILKEEET